MRCTTSHWQGDTFVASGTMLPEGHAQVIPAFFEPVEFEDAPAPKKTSAAKKP